MVTILNNSVLKTSISLLGNNIHMHKMAPNYSIPDIPLSYSSHHIHRHCCCHSTASYYCIFCAPFYNTLLFTTLFFKFFYFLQICLPFTLKVYYLHQSTASSPPRLMPQSFKVGDMAKVATPNETFAAMISSTRKV